MKRTPTAEPQPISDHFWAALFFVVRAHYSTNDCKAWAASRPGPPQQRSEGRTLASEARRAEHRLLDSAGRAQPLLGHGIQKALFVPTNQEQNSSSEVHHGRGTARSAGRREDRCGSTVPVRRAEDRPCRGARLE